MGVKFKCARCDKDAEYDPDKDAVKIKARIESEQFGRDVYYHAVRCPHCGMRNELRPPDDKTAPQKLPGAAPAPAGPAQSAQPGQKPAK